jgi:hypothetical protein
VIKKTSGDVNSKGEMVGPGEEKVHGAFRLADVVSNSFFKRPVALESDSQIMHFPDNLESSTVDSEIRSDTDHSFGKNHNLSFVSVNGELPSIAVVRSSVKRCLKLRWGLSENEAVVGVKKHVNFNHDFQVVIAQDVLHDGTNHGQPRVFSADVLLEVVNVKTEKKRREVVTLSNSDKTVKKS